MRRLAAPVAVVVALLVALGCSAAAAPPPAPHVEISQQLLDLQGNPSFVANFVPDGALATPSWAICAPAASTCTPAGVTNQVFEPGPVPVGTRFEASATYAGTTSTARSDAWLGRVAATAPPTLTGSAKVGGHVTAHGGAWTGGWGGEFDILHVEACRTASGRDCTTIVHPRAFRRSPAIDPRWSGHYLFAFDERYAKGTGFELIGYRVPFAIAPTPVGPTVSRSAPLGPVTGPGLALREHPLLLRDERLLLGRVTCAQRCGVSVRLRAESAGVGARFEVRGTRRIAVPARDLPLDQELGLRIRVGSAPPVETTILRHTIVAARAR